VSQQKCVPRLTVGWRKKNIEGPQELRRLRIPLPLLQPSNASALALHWHHQGGHHHLCRHRHCRSSTATVSLHPFRRHQMPRLWPSIDLVEEATTIYDDAMLCLKGSPRRWLYDGICSTGPYVGKLSFSSSPYPLLLWKIIEPSRFSFLCQYAI
jgi:hypothetical protein